MFKLFCLLSLGMLGFVFSGTSDVVLPAGTELMVLSQTEVDSSVLTVGSDVNFELAADAAGKSITVVKGSKIFGRVVEVNNYSEASGKSRVIVLFDFLQNGEDFYTFSASLMDNPATAGMTLEESKTYGGGTIVTKKGSDIKIAAGTEFKIKLSKDCKTEG